MTATRRLDVSSLFTCPYCDAPPGVFCRTRNGDDAQRTHSARFLEVPDDPEADRLAIAYYERQRAERKLTPDDERALERLLARQAAR